MKLKYVAAVAAALIAPISAFAPTAAVAQSAPIGAGQRIFVATPGNVIATFVGSNAGYNDTLFLEGRNDPIFNNKTSMIGDTVDLGSFAIGTELVFRLNVAEGRNSSFDYFSGPADRNSDGVVHAAANTIDGVTTVGFEDFRFGGDNDFNDLTFSFSNTVAGAVPEPATWAMMLVGFGGIGFAMRRRKSKVTTKIAYA